MSKSNQDTIINALEKAMILQIRECCAEEYKWLLENGIIQPEFRVANNIAVGGSFAMVYHGLLPAFNDIDVFLINEAFSQAFIKSDAERARKESKPVERTKCLYYDWYVDQDTFEVYSYYSGRAVESFSTMTRVAFGVGDKPVYHKRLVRRKNVFDVDELYCQYATLNNKFPDNAKYAERMGMALDAFSAKIATDFEEVPVAGHPGMNEHRFIRSRKHSLGG